MSGLAAAAWGGQGLMPEYRAWSDLLSSDTLISDAADAPTVRTSLPMQDWFYSIYAAVNLGADVLENTDSSPDRYLRARDGRLVYPATDEVKDISGDEIKSVLTYSYMDQYQISADYERDLRRLIVFAQSHDVEVYFLLSPYHPDVFERMKSNAAVFMDVEQYMRRLAADYSVPVLGSYDPAPYKCNPSEFYDGMHPKSTCLDQILLHHRVYSPSAH